MLTDSTIKNAKPKEKHYKLNDGRGLFLLVHKNGGKYFRLDFTFNGRRGTLALGVYPYISLKQARQKQYETRQQIAAGIDPAAAKKAIKQAAIDSVVNSLEVVAREWINKRLSDKSASHQNKTLAALKTYIFPGLGSAQIDTLKPMALLAVLRQVEANGAIETAHRLLSVCGRIFRYAIATGRAERDIAADLRGALTTTKKGHFAAITEPVEVGRLLRSIDDYGGTFIVKSALQLAPLIFVRPSELCNMEWKDVDLVKAEWRYFITKTNIPHIVPLSTQAINILSLLTAVTGNGRYVFPNIKTPHGSSPMTSAALVGALRRLGYTASQMTVHGFRAMARTLLDEVLNYRPDYIEHQLAHRVVDSLGTAYNRTRHLSARKEMMQAWSDYLDELKDEGASNINIFIMNEQGVYV